MSKSVVTPIIQEIAFYEQAATLPSVHRSYQALCKLRAIGLYCKLLNFGIDLPDALAMVDAWKKHSPIKDKRS